MLALLLRQRRKHTLQRIPPLTRWWASSSTLATSKASLSPASPASSTSPASPTTSETTATSSALEESAASGNDGKRLYYLDNVFPLRLHFMDPRFLFFQTRSSEMVKALVLQRLVPPDLTPLVSTIIPRLRDGGAIVELDTGASNKPDLILQLWRKHLAGLGVQWFNGQGQNVYPVLGRPFLANLAGRLPCTKIKVEFSKEYNTVAPIEALYDMFRTYGTIYDIVTPPPVKDISRHVFLTYTRKRAAATAYNCIYGVTIPGLSEDNRIRISYGQATSIRKNVLNYINSHPRVFIPAFVAALIAASFALFDPIREFCIKQKATNLERTGWAGRLFVKTRSVFFAWWNDVPLSSYQGFHPNHHHHHYHMQLDWEGLAEDEAQLKQWLDEAPSTFLVVTGPNGSGKTELVRRVVQGRKWRLWIDGEDVIQARNDENMITTLAEQVGYWPIFTALLKLSKMLEGIFSLSIGGGGAGGNTGISTDANEMIRHILESTALALDDIDGNPSKNLPTKDQIELRDQAHYQTEEYPVIVLDDFICREGPELEKFWTDLSEWAAALVEKKVCHVIVVARNGAAAARWLHRVLPNKSMNVVSLQDVSTEAALQYVQKRLPALEKFDSGEIRLAVDKVGGRINDLQLFVQKLAAGASVHQATKELVQRAAREIRRLAFAEEVEHSRVWTSVQFWHLLRALSEHGAVSYDAIRMHPLFEIPAANAEGTSQGELALRALERHDLIQLVHRDTRPFVIHPGKPLYLAAYRYILQDVRLTAVMEQRYQKALIQIEQAKMQKYEAEMAQLAQILENVQTAGIRKASVDGCESRLKFLGTRLAKSAEKVEEAQKRLDQAKRVNSDPQKLAVSSEERLVIDAELNELVT